MAVLQERTNPIIAERTGSTPVTRGAAVRDRAGLEFFLFHLTLAAFFVASQAALVPSWEMSADNSWHFRLARDILTGREVFWAGVDANRFFPDLLYSLTAFLMPGGGGYPTWLYYYYAIDIIALYASMVALAATLFDDVYRRRVFLVCAVAGFAVTFTALPFWAFWLLAPGNHGGGLPVCFLSLALLFQMNRVGKVSPVAGSAVLVMVSLLAGSNRLLLITFVAPLFAALVAVFVRRHLVGRVYGQGASIGLAAAGAPVLPLIAIAGTAGVAGFLAWHALNGLSWFRLVAPGTLPSMSPTVEWLVEAVVREKDALVTVWSTSYAWDIVIGLVMLGAAALLGCLILARAIRPSSPTDENRLILTAFVVVSLLAALAFTAVKNDSETWRYRYLATPIAFAIVFLSMLPPLSLRLSAMRALFPAAAGLALAGLLVWVAMVGAQRRVPEWQSEVGFQRSVAEFTRTIARHAPSTDPKLKGYAEYWLATATAARSDSLQVGVLDSMKPEVRLYNDSPADLCGDDHFFIALSSERDEPRKAEVLSALGEPNATDQLRMPRFGIVTVMYYDPALIRSRITLPGREKAKALFPSFACAR